MSSAKAQGGEPASDRNDMNDFIKLSLWQRWKLRKFFKSVEAANKAGDCAAIGAQIWKDGMHVRLFNAERGRALSDALGGNWKEKHGSMASRRASTSNAVLSGAKRPLKLKLGK